LADENRGVVGHLLDPHCSGRAVIAKYAEAADVVPTTAAADATDGGKTRSRRAQVCAERAERVARAG
jgi:hypothetical protein